jgi:hypothetical protein
VPAATAQAVAVDTVARDTATTSSDAALRYDGRAGRLDVRVPRAEADIAVDGRLDEPAWRSAAVLTGFTTFNPVDGRPALDATEVRVWYSATAIHFGIRAWAPSGTVRATLADRDRIASDDHVQILLDTFDDRRRAFLFAVNPLGVQLDGMRSESGGGGGPGQSRAAVTQSDISQDFIWQSKGQLLEDGYTVELRVPFKSLRFQRGDVQDWGIQIVRQTQRTGYQDTWAPASRGNASFLVQRGRLQGLTDLRRGLVLDMTPVATTLTNGVPPVAPTPGDAGSWRYATRAQWGGDARWGVTPNLTANATINPDFSQVETDVGQIPGDIRFAINFPELRPFFVEGSEQLDTPNQLVYTRNVVRPTGAAKLTGKVSRGDLGVLTAVDDAGASAGGRQRPRFTFARYRRDLGLQSNAAITLTDRSEGAVWNRVVAADARAFFRRIYTWNAQVGWSATRDASGDVRAAPLWETNLGRTGRNYGFRYEVTGIAPAFETRSGFVPRTDFVRLNTTNRTTWFGKKGRAVEQWSNYFQANALWTYGGAFAGATPLETRAGVNSIASLRGGWSVTLNPLLETYAFDPARYAALRVERRTADGVDTVPFTPGARVSTLGTSLRVATPQYRRWAGSLRVQGGRDVDFLEAQPARRLDVDAQVDLRPTGQLRVTGLLRRSTSDRADDGPRLLATTIPRLRAEYQLNRAVFVRFVGQYEARARDTLRDWRTGDVLLTERNDGIVRLDATRSNRLRVDWLFSFLPSPGRVVYVGYGSSLEEDTAFRLRQVRRTADGMFVKASWLWRAGSRTGG